MAWREYGTQQWTAMDNGEVCFAFNGGPAGAPEEPSSPRFSVAPRHISYRLAEVGREIAELDEFRVLVNLHRLLPSFIHSTFPTGWEAFLPPAKMLRPTLPVWQQSYFAPRRRLSPRMQLARGPVAFARGLCVCLLAVVLLGGRRQRNSLITGASGQTINQGEVRAFDGSNNNANDPTRGAARIAYNRFVTSRTDFDPKGVENLRDISNKLALQQRDIRSQRQLTVLHTFWGEFLIHDIAHVINSKVPGDGGSVSVSSGDPSLPAGSMNYTRAVGTGTGLGRLPINAQTSYLDASHIYGTSKEQSDALRDGFLFKTDGAGFPQFVPQNPQGTNTSLSFLLPFGSDQIFSLGSIVGNTSPYTQAFYVLFIREHNRYAQLVKKSQPSLSDEDVFQNARAHVIALIQGITYYEYLPLLLGRPLEPPFWKYDASLRADVDTFFAGSAYRFGHSEVPSALFYLDAAGRAVQTDMASNIFKTNLIKQVELSPLFRGMATQVQQEPDIFYTDMMRSQLFGPKSGLDAFAFDIFRARDYLTGSYSDMRRFFNLSVPQSFADINPTFADALSQSYKDVSQVDAIVGGFLEQRDQLASNVGPLFAATIRDQMQRIRDGDRFWFENPGVLDADHLNEVRSTTLRDVIVRNTPDKGGRGMPANIWQVVPGTALKSSDIPSSFDFNHDFAPGFRLVWSIINKGQPNEAVRYLVQCAYQGFCAFGFGDTMPTATDMFIARKLSNGTILMQEYAPSGAYSPPAPSKQPMIRDVQTKLLDPAQGIYQVQFTRPTQPSSSGKRRAQLSDSNSNVIFSFNIMAASDITFHGSNRGQLTMNFFRNEVSSRGRINLATNPALMTHVVMMMTVFGFSMPAAVVVARYFRTRNGWITLHVGLQTMGGFLAIVAGAVAISVTTLGTSVHSYMGVLLYTVILFQLVAGFMNLGRLISLSCVRAARIIKFVHNYTGRFILAYSAMNIAFGIDVVHPISTPANLAKPLWIVYMLLITFWVSVFATLETRRKVKVVKLASAEATESGKFDSKKVAATYMAVQQRDQLPTLSWKELDENVRENDKLWVVGNGLVYDIKKWIPSHPGGQLVLYAVVGTDISTDFFNEEGYDEDVFRPYTSDPGREDTNALKRASETGMISTLRRRFGFKEDGDTSTLKANVSSKPSGPVPFRPSRMSKAPSDWRTSRPDFGAHYDDAKSDIQTEVHGIDNREVSADPRVTAEDWRLIMQARRQHVHSRSAIEKLKDLVVARIEGTENRFNKDEYRRYALTTKKLLSGDGADANLFHVKFCLLFPNEVNPEEPLFFLPGQAIEIQVRHQRKYVSRYFTPISGNMLAFEMIIKCLKGGVMSQIIENTRPGEMQFKVRGPFGSPLINVDRPLPVGNGCWDKVVCLGVGSGITPHLQLLNWYFLQTTFSLTSKPNRANGPNELTVHNGGPDERVFIRYPLRNGWVFANNTATEEDGAIRLSKLKPWIGKGPKVLVANAARNEASIVGGDMLEGLRAAYPEQVQLVYSYSREHPSPAESKMKGFDVRHGHLDAKFLKEMMSKFRWFEDYRGENTQRVFLCGPESFLETSYNALIAIGVDEADIVVLPAHSYLSNPHWKWRSMSYTSRSSKSAKSKSPTSPTPPMPLPSQPSTGMPPTPTTPLESSLGNPPAALLSSFAGTPSIPPAFIDMNHSEQGDLSNQSEGGSLDQGFMTIRAYRSHLPPMPLRKNPTSHEPEYYYLPSATAMRPNGQN